MAIDVEIKLYNKSESELSNPKPIQYSILNLNLYNHLDKKLCH